MRRPALLALSVLTLTLAACGGGEGDSGPTVLMETLGRVSAEDGLGDSISFSDQDRLRDYPEVKRIAVNGYGARSLTPYQEELPTTLGIELRTADVLLTVGTLPEETTLIVGGQDTEEIRTAATDAGWSGADVLVRETNPGQPLTLRASRIRPLGESVAVGAGQADLAAVDGEGKTLADDPTVSALGSCLGDVVLAVFDSSGDAPVAVGVRPGDKVRSVICVLDDDPEKRAQEIASAVESDNDSASTPYADRFLSPKASAVEDAAQVVMVNTDRTYPVTILQMLAQKDLPGLKS